jgi:hypothetical protein
VTEKTKKICCAEVLGFFYSWPTFLKQIKAKKAQQSLMNNSLFQVIIAVIIVKISNESLMKESISEHADERRPKRVGRKRARD